MRDWTEPTKRVLLPLRVGVVTVRGSDVPGAGAPVERLARLAALLEPEDGAHEGLLRVAARDEVAVVGRGRAAAVPG